MSKQIPFRELASKFKSKFEKIKVLAFDVDGVLTTGHIHYTGAEMGWNRFFHTSDGYALKIMKQAGLKVGVISGGDSLGVKARFVDNLNLDFAYLGSEDKREAYKKLLAMGYKDEEILYMGDELFDLPLLKRAGFSATTPIASLEVLEGVDYVTTREPGMGAVRELIDIFRMARDIYPAVAEFED